jgi:DNA-binding transcriptional LysR family regulator
LPRLVLEDELASGALVQVMAGLLEGQNSVAVVYPEREFVPPQVRAFVDAVVAWAPQMRGPAKVTSSRSSRTAAVRPRADARRG